MGLFKKSPEQKAALEKERSERKAEEERKKAEYLRKREEKAFAESPAGKARAAKASGASIFQIDLPLSKTAATVIPLGDAYGQSSKTNDYAATIEAIEQEGWRLDHAGYVYRVTGSESREKALGSGQREAVTGEIIGIYIFRAESS
ncbi:hypothetical protein [Marinobacter sp. MMG032]|uniref:PASTA domain-containing protein n=1 Tax=Marinobacter sp. MMG032 TaxID=3158548 RepID=A0AAU7MPE6_9GAMM